MALSCKSLPEGNVSPGVDRGVGGKRLMEFSPCSRDNEVAR